MFTLREFILKGLLDAVGKMADYQIILNATGWYEKNVLTLEDLAVINKAIDDKNTPEETPEEFSSIDEIQEENNEIEE